MRQMLFGKVDSPRTSNRGFKPDTEPQSLDLELGLGGREEEPRSTGHSDLERLF